MAVVLTVRRDGPETIQLPHWTGELSVGLFGEIPREFELKQLQFGKGVDASGGSIRDLDSRKADRRRFGTKTPQQSLSQLQKEYPSINFNVVSMRKERPEPTQEDYNLLGCTPDTPFMEVRQLYRKLMIEFHPDKQTGDEAKAKRLTVAYAKVKQACLKN